MIVMAATEILARSTTLTSVGWIGYIIIGALAGWIASRIMKTREGLLLDIVLGVVGALVGGFLLSFVVDTAAGGWWFTLFAAILGAVILLCYGGGFGTMPAFAADYFGAKNVGPIYGLMLTAWGFASAFGPLLIAYLRQADGTYRGALHIIAGVMLVSAVLPVFVSPPRSVETPQKRDAQGDSTGEAQTPVYAKSGRTESTRAVR